MHDRITPGPEEFAAAAATFGIDWLRERVVEGLLVTIRRCMQAEKVNIDAATVMVREVLRHDYEMDEADAMTVDFMTNAFEEAAARAQLMLAEARKLLAEHESGSPTPRPYDPVEHIAARADLFMSAREHGH